VSAQAVDQTRAGILHLPPLFRLASELFDRFDDVEEA
jgi:hypothetical protein